MKNTVFFYFELPLIVMCMYSISYRLDWIQWTVNMLISLNVATVTWMAETSLKQIIRNIIGA